MAGFHGYAICYSGCKQNPPERKIPFPGRGLSADSIGGAISIGELAKENSVELQGKQYLR